jgi:hypothetical protein
MGERQWSSAAFACTLAVICLLLMFAAPPVDVEGCALSPPARTIRKFFYYSGINEDIFGPPIVTPCCSPPSTIPIKGLEVTVWYGGHKLGTWATSDTGLVELVGVPDGTYTFSWSWGGDQYNEPIQITCAQRIWEFCNYLPAKGGEEFFSSGEGGTPLRLLGSSPPAKTLKEHFYYGDINRQLFGWYEGQIPVQNLPVSVWYNRHLLGTWSTGTNGLINLAGIPDGWYMLNWTWCGQPMSRNETICCSKIVWEFENFLTAKGGDKAAAFLFSPLESLSVTARKGLFSSVLAEF